MRKKERRLVVAAMRSGGMVVAEGYERDRGDCGGRWCLWILEERMREKEIDFGE